jgi:hypothetical protein
MKQDLRRPLAKPAELQNTVAANQFRDFRSISGNSACFQNRELRSGENRPFHTSNYRGIPTQTISLVSWDKAPSSSTSSVGELG